MNTTVHNAATTASTSAPAKLVWIVVTVMILAVAVAAIVVAVFPFGATSQGPASTPHGPAIHVTNQLNDQCRPTLYAHAC